MTRNKNSWKIALLGAGASLLFAPAVGAVVETNSARQSSPETHRQMPLELAQQQYCPDRTGGMPMVDFFETDNFWIYICEADGLYYHGVEKGPNGGYITIPAYVEEGTGYVAENGIYTYIVNGASLSIYEGNTLLQEDWVY
jgi:hypothetical protein